MIAALDIHDCVYCNSPIDTMPTLTQVSAEDPKGATYYCGNCQSNFTIYFDEDEDENVTKF